MQYVSVKLSCVYADWAVDSAKKIKQKKPRLGFVDRES